MRLDSALLRAAVGCTADLADIYADHLAYACAMHDITSPVRLAAFLAQVGHESGSLKHTAELWGPTDAQRSYEGRKNLGNVQIGDGFFFRGRGLIQVTGRANMTQMAEWLGLDLLGSPELLEQPRWAALSAATWWARHGCNQLADAGDFEALTRRINGGINGLDDRLKRWERAKAALAATTPAPAKEPPPVLTDAPATAPPMKAPPRPDQEPYIQPEAATMPIAPIIGALLPSLIEAIPKLGKLFGSGSAVAERNIAAATMAMEVAQQATGAINAQAAIEAIKADPAVAAAAAKAVESRWLEIAEAGGGGIDGARKADTQASGGVWWKSPSFLVAGMLLPLVYLLVLSLIGIIGTATWSDDVRAGLAGSLISAIIGGLVGYYYGQTTSRNRTPAA